jgi:hypothetical protein
MSGHLDRHKVAENKVSVLELRLFGLCRQILRALRIFTCIMEQEIESNLGSCHGDEVSEYISFTWRKILKPGMAKNHYFVIILVKVVF